MVFIKLIVLKIKLLLRIFLDFLVLYNNDDKGDEMEKEAYKKEVERNVKFLKVIGGVAIICFFNMPMEHAVYVVGSIIMSEGLDLIVLKWKE